MNFNMKNMYIKTISENLLIDIHGQYYFLKDSYLHEIKIPKDLERLSNEAIADLYHKKLYDDCKYFHLIDYINVNDDQIKIEYLGKSITINSDKEFVVSSGNYNQLQTFDVFFDRLNKISFQQMCDEIIKFKNIRDQSGKLSNAKI